MPLVLDTPFSMGELDPLPFNLVHITRFSIDLLQQNIYLDIVYARVVNGQLELSPHGAQNITITGQPYNQLLANSMPQNGETTYAAVRRSLYAFLRVALPRLQGNIT